MIWTTIHKRPMPALAAFIAMLVIAPAAMAALENENLLTPLPPGFKIGFQTQRGRMVMAEYVPAVESVDDWSRMITAQTFHGLANFDPDTFAGGIAKQWNSACVGGQALKITGVVENGYKVSIWQFTCPTNVATKKPENMWMKAISGQDSLYLVQYAYRKALTKDLVVPAMSYLRQVLICDTRLADRPCPRGM